MFTSGNRSYSVNPGALLYIPEKACYSQQTQREIIYTVHFVNHSSHETDLELMEPNDPTEALSLMEQLWHEWDNKKICYHYRCNVLLYTLLESASKQKFSEYFRTVAPENRLSGALDYLYRNYRRNNLSVIELVVQSHYSEIYFRQLFIQLFGVPPKKYIQDLRLEYAEQLLRSQLYSVQQTAQIYGFDNPKHFSDAFRKKYGHPTKGFSYWPTLVYLLSRMNFMLL